MKSENLKFGKKKRKEKRKVSANDEKILTVAKKKELLPRPLPPALLAAVLQQRRSGMRQPLFFRHIGNAMCHRVYFCCYCANRPLLLLPSPSLAATTALSGPVFSGRRRTMHDLPPFPLCTRRGFLLSLRIPVQPPDNS